MTDERTPAEQAEAMKRSLLADYHMTFTSEPGKRVLEDMRKSAGYYLTEPAYDSQGRVDPSRCVMRDAARLFVGKIEKHLRDAVAGQVEPTQTHAVSSTATQEP